jgi:hypothetical protein
MDKKGNYESARDSRCDTDNMATADQVRDPYRMIETFSAEGFRGFRELHLKGLKTINVLVGRSGAGKTAFLEALRLATAAIPATAWNLNAQRGVLSGIPPNPTRKQYESPWSSLFFDFNVDSPISFSTIDSERAQRKCRIFFDQDTPIAPTPVPQQPNAPLLPEVLFTLIFERTSDTGEITRVPANIVLIPVPQFWSTVNIQTIYQYQLQMQAAPELGPTCEILHANTQYNMQQTAQKYSELSIAGVVDEIDNAIKSAFPEITSIQTQAPAAGVIALYVTTAYRKNQIPLALYSAGISKFVALLVEIQARSKSTLLVDEIENGIWYKMMPTLWSTLHKFAVRHETQLFLSTHSAECLKAAVPTINEHPSDFALMQMSHDVDGTTGRLASGEDMVAAIESNIELRR